MLCMCQEFPNKKNPSVTNMENITGSMATSVIIAHSSLLIILTIVIVFVYLYLNFETNRDGKQCKCGKASVIGAQGQQLSVLPPVPGQPSPSPACQVCALFLYLSLKTKVFLIHCTLYFTGHSSAPPSSVHSFFIFTSCLGLAA